MWCHRRSKWDGQAGVDNQLTSLSVILRLPHEAQMTCTAPQPGQVEDGYKSLIPQLLINFQFEIKSFDSQAPHVL